MTAIVDKASRLFRSVPWPARTPMVRQRASRDGRIRRGLVIVAAVWLLLFVLLPLYQIILRSFLNRHGHWVGLANYVRYFATPSLSATLGNSLYVSLMSTLITVVLAFLFAYSLERTCMRGKRILQMMAMLPVFAPSLLHAIAFVYLFGNQGLLTTGFFGVTKRVLGISIGLDIGLYRGPTGIILAEVFYLFPHALLILIISLRLADARLYEAATALRASRLRTFFTVTLPSVRYGLISACFVCFTLVITDFGIPKVIGGQYNVLATDIYKQVIGQQNFNMGATVSVLLLAPTILGFVIDRVAQRNQSAMVTARMVPFAPKPQRVQDGLALLLCTLIALAIVGVMGTALAASLIDIWPYRLQLSTRHYSFGSVGGGGMPAYWNSVRMATYTAIFGTAIVFGSAYLIEKGRAQRGLRSLLYFLSTLPVALPGLVLGLAYIFFFNRSEWHIPLTPWRIPSPVNWLYGTMAILVISTIVHFYTVSFFTAMAALKQLDAEFEAVSESLSVPFWRTFWRVTLPVSLPAVLEIGIYFFVNAMTTVSAVIFLYSANLKLASVAVVNMDDAGDVAPAAAMSILIFATGVTIRLLYHLATRGMRRRSQLWIRG